jgi:hypothetical protein
LSGSSLVLEAQIELITADIVPDTYWRRVIRQWQWALGQAQALLGFPKQPLH